MYYETIGGGQGGRPWATGMSGVHTAMTNTTNTPIEALERAFPLRVLRSTLAAGERRRRVRRQAATGSSATSRCSTDATVSLITERRVSQPWGLAGGEPGAWGRTGCCRAATRAAAERLPDKCTIQLKAGDVLRMLTPGGGGWGKPSGPGRA